MKYKFNLILILFITTLLSCAGNSQLKNVDIDSETLREKITTIYEFNNTGEIKRETIITENEIIKSLTKKEIDSNDNFIDNFFNKILIKIFTYIIIFISILVNFIFLFSIIKKRFFGNDFLG